jgi:LPS-assembly protein
MAGAFAGHSGGAAAQDAALSVDPALLDAPEPQIEPRPESPLIPGGARRDAAPVVRPVAPAAVEIRPAGTAANVPDAPEKTPEAAKSESVPADSRTEAPEQDAPRPALSGASETSAAASDASVSTEIRPAPAASPKTQAETATVQASARTVSASRATALEPLRVDPALLGAPPSAPAARFAEVSPSPRAPSAPEPAIAATSPSSPSLSAREGGEDERRGGNESPDRELAPVLRAASKMASPSGGGQAPRPVFLSALRMEGEVNREFVAEGEVELRKTGSLVNSELMTYWPLEDEVEAEGRVRLQQGEDVVTGPKMRLRLEDQIGYFEQPFYRLKHLSLLGEKADSAHEASDREIERLTADAGWNSGFATPQAMKFIPGQTRFDEKIKLSQTTESRGEAERLHFEGENQYRLENNTFTTCPVDNDSWYVKTSELKLDYDNEVGEGKNATVYFKDVPFLYSPWIAFSLNNRRASGFLPPSVGTNSDKGFEYEQPYYWNIAPNMDATISPHLMSKRGVQIGNEFRYLNTAFGGLYHGRAVVEYLPSDRMRDGKSRHAISLVHNQTARNGLSGAINFSKVSDDDYYTDLSSDISRSSQTQLLQQGMLSYGGGGWWSASVNFQQYQTLQPDRNNPVLEQYRMLPRVTLRARKPDFRGMDFNLLGQYTHFTIREREQSCGTPGGQRTCTIYPDGHRTVLYPQISFPYVTPGWYVTPKLGVNHRSYSLTGQAPGKPGSISVTLPVLSVDSGMAFERSSRWFGRDYTQTLEPRLYYVNIPYRDQKDIPLFDTGLADFNFAQMFSENQFSGMDRMNNANQLTAALTSRLIDPADGSEIMRAMIGQRYYFTRNKVALNRTTVSSNGTVTYTGTSVANEDDKWERSDILASFSGQILPKVYVDTAWQYAIADSRTQRYSLNVRYQPEPGKVLNAAYRYNRQTTSPVNQVDVSGQWPLFGRWHGVGRLNYSFKDDGTVLSTGGQGGRIIESIAGLEYNGGCWILRGVIRRQALTSVDASTAFYVQLELSGLGRIGSSPLSLLKRNIQGYSLIGENDSDSVF